jgi:hypothetical protein
VIAAGISHDLVAVAPGIDRKPSGEKPRADKGRRTIPRSFSSKQRFNTQKVRELQEMRAALERLLGKLPADLQGDPDVQKLAPLCDRRDWTIAHINNRCPAQRGQYKDAEFSRPAVTERWAAGLEDVRLSAANLEWMQPMELGGIHVYYLPRSAPSAPRNRARRRPESLRSRPGRRTNHAPTRARAAAPEVAPGRG